MKRLSAEQFKRAEVEMKRIHTAVMSGRRDMAVKKKRKHRRAKLGDFMWLWMSSLTHQPHGSHPEDGVFPPWQVIGTRQLLKPPSHRAHLG